MARERLDKVLLDRGLVASRERARALIMTGSVLVRGRPQTKPGTMVDPSDDIALREHDHPYVSRGALKLVKGLDHFGIDPSGMTALDIGASTGGFTDVLLRRRVERVREWASAHGFTAGDDVESPITGPAGNVEFLLLLRTAPDAPADAQTR